MIKDILEKFMKEIQENNVEIYNEFSLQHELGLYHRNALSDYKVQFERNVRFFNISNTIKSEIDKRSIYKKMVYYFSRNKKF